MNKALFGLLNTVAITTSSILNDGKEHLANMIGNNASSWQYTVLGVGNDTSHIASANNSGLYGTNATYANCNATYEADYKSTWEHTFNYSDITGHKFGEAVITKNQTEYADNCLARIVYNDIELNISDTLKLSLTVGF